MLKNIKISTTPYLKDDEVLASPCACEVIINLYNIAVVAKKYCLNNKDVDDELHAALAKVFTEMKTASPKEPG